MGAEVTAVSTAGSLESRKKLLAGDVDLAILQPGAVPSDGLAALAALYEDVVCVVVRRGLRIASVRDLVGRSVILGPEGSGMREQALRLLTRYRIEILDTEVSYFYFTRMMEDVTIDAAIITTGLMNPDLNRLLGTGEFNLVPILDTEAIAIHHPLFQRFEVPRGLFYEGPAVPSEPIVTVATPAVLVAREDASGRLVSETLAAVYETSFPANVPTMIPKSEASERSGLPLHAAARSYFNPYEGIDLLSNFIQSIAAGKELLFALGAGVYLLWDRLRRLKAKREAANVAAQKEVLWKLLNDTVRIEREQMSTTNVDALKEFLDDVTRIKLRSLDELTHHAC